jgi:uncharacterized OsmC-like protein
MAKIGNGVNLSKLEELFRAIKRIDALGDVKFAAKSVWKGGTRTDVTVSAYYAGGQNLAPAGRKFTILIDEPVELGGQDTAPNPMEYLAAAICGCITAGITTQAGFANAEVSELEVGVEAEVNVRGLLGIDDSPSSCSNIDYSVRMAGPAGETLLTAKKYIDQWSPVVSSLRSEVPVTTSEQVTESTVYAEAKM